MWKFQIWMLCIVIYETFIYECYFIYLMKLSYIWMLFHIATNAISYMKPSWYISCYIKILYMNAIFHIYIYVISYMKSSYMNAISYMKLSYTNAISYMTISYMNRALFHIWMLFHIYVLFHIWSTFIFASLKSG